MPLMRLSEQLSQVQMLRQRASTFEEAFFYAWSGYARLYVGRCWQVRLAGAGVGDQAGNQACFMLVGLDGKPLRKELVRNDRNQPTDFEVTLDLNRVSTSLVLRSSMISI